MKERLLQKSQLSNALVNCQIMEVQLRLFKSNQKSQFSISFMNWKKFGSIHRPRSTFQNSNFEYMDEFAKSYVLI